MSWLELGIILEAIGAKIASVKGGGHPVSAGQ